MSKSLSTITEFDEKVVELYIQGKGREVIASTLEVPLKEVTKVLKKDNIKQLMTDIIEQKEVMLKGASIATLEKMLQEKLANAEDVDDLLSSNRDVLDIIDAINKTTKEQEKKRLGTSTGNVFVQIMNDLT